MRVERFRFAEKKPDLQLAIDSANSRANLVALFQIMLPDEFFRDRDGARRAEPTLNIECARLEITRIERAKRRVRENLDPQNLEVHPAEIRHVNESIHDQRRR